MTRTDTPDALTRAWLALAIAAFALSALFAVGLVAARTPFLAFLGFGGASFRAALVSHVDLALLVWFLAFAAARWQAELGGAAPALRWAGFGLAAAGTLLIGAAPFTGAAPLLANYFPALAHPLFFAGVTWFVAGIALVALACARGLPAALGRGGDPARLGVALSLLPLAAAGLSVLLAGLPQAPVAQWDTAGYEAAVWGAGHLAQFVYVLLMMSAWWRMAAAGGARPGSRRLAVLALWLTALPAAAAPALHWVYGGEPMALRRAFTLLMTWGLWPGPLTMALVCAWLSLRRDADAVARTALWLSLLLFLAGCAFGALIQRDSTLVPAHYHCTIGAVTVAFMGWIYVLAPALGWSAAPGRALGQLRSYAAGLALLAAGLAGSALANAPRKTAHAELLAPGGGYLAAMSLAGIGGLLAVVGAAWFVVNVVRAAWPRAAPRRRQDVRLPALAGSAVVIVALGFALAYWPRPDAYAPQRAHAQAKRAEEVRLRFDQGVAMLHARQYEHALTAFHRVLQLAPELPEAHVNTGFALLGLGRYKEARDFFESATELRRDQANAYYGLAVSLEGLKDLPSAVGAMRTYLHRSPPDDPYRRKAEAALWEWEAALKPARPLAAAAPGAPQSSRNRESFPESK